MKRILGIIAATAMVVHANAQNASEGDKLINYGKFESAKNAMQPLANNNPEAAYYLGIAELELGNLTEAMNVFSKNPADYRNQAGTARVLYKQGKPQEAEKILFSIIDKTKRKEWEKYKVAADAITYTKGGNLTDAINWYNKALEIQDKDANLYIALGDAYRKTEAGGGNAMTSYEKAAEKGNNNSLAYSRIGSLWYDAHKYDLALENYNKAKDTDPGNPLPYRDLAYAYFRAGRYENALENIKTFLSLSDKAVDDQITYANLLFLTKNYSEAHTVLQELINKGVKKPSLHRALGYAQYELKDYTNARASMHKFFAEEESENIIHSDYIYSGKIMLALADQDSTQLQLYSDSADYYFNIAVSKDSSSDKSQLYTEIAEGYKDAKLYDKAGIWFGKVVTAKANPEALDYFNWGLYSYYGRDYKLSAQAFEEMVTKYPEEGSGYYWQARVAAAIDSEAKTGAAEQYYLNWLNFNKEGYQHKDADLKYAYNYLAWYYFNAEREKDAMIYINKILEDDPQNEFANQVKDYYEKLKASKAQ